MHTSKNINTIGVIVARFQVVDLHRGHRFLIEYVQDRHPELLVVLGSRGGVLDEKDFLPFDVRRDLVLQSYPHAKVIELQDHPIDNEAWSRELDALIATIAPGKSATLYGSRNSFLREYTGQMTRVEVPQMSDASGTAQRASIDIPNTRDVRMGMLKAAKLRYPTCFATTDLAILNQERTKVILIGRTRELGKLRFPGGFVDPTDESHESAVLRERREELPTVNVRYLRHIGSCRIDDRRYRGSRDGIMTTFFSATYADGELTAGDDADTAAWVELYNLRNVLVDSHQPLATMLTNFV